MRRLSDERGIALIMALAVMLVLSVLVTSALAFTSSNSRDASRSSGAQKAYAAAEAGINQALAAVQTAGSDTTKMPTHASPLVVNLPNGVTATWYGSYAAATKVWTLTSTGSVPNPTGPTASALTRTITQTASITPPPYTFVALNSSCDNHTLLVETSGQLNVTNAMYINSCSGGDAFDIFGAGGNIADPKGITTVGGWETHNGSTVTASGTLCPLSSASPPNATTGCPVTGQPIIPDPFTAPGTPASYSPSQTVSTTMTAAQTTLTSSGTAIATGDVIQVDNELMLVTAGGGSRNLTVQRGYFNTAAATHTSGAQIKNVPVVGKITPPALGSPACTSSATQTVAYTPAVTLNGNITVGATSPIPIKWTSGSDPVAVNDVILIESEQMTVTGVTPVTATTANLTVTRASNGTTAAAHNSGKAVSRVVTVVYGSAANPSPCLFTSGTVNFQPGTYYGGICIGSLSTANCDSSNCTTSGQVVAYNPAVTLNGNITVGATTPIPIKWTSGSDPVAVNDVIVIESEQMTVTAVTPVTATTANLTVTRASNGTTAAAHNSGKAVTKYIAPPHVTATMAPGTYVMAGGGFRVCGASTLTAPDGSRANVLIYNTQDPTSPTGFGALDQFELNTTGSVSLGPQTSGTPYDGLTIFQDRSLALDAAVDCNTRDNVTTPTQTDIDEYDIALVSMGSSGTNGALGSISGSLYAPANRTVFADEVSGTANLAVLTSCIVVNGGNSTFAYDPAGLFGSGWALGPQAG